ncbi:MAG: hypothetical protein AAF436_00530 [Myxococcota bacterium]
MAVYIMSFLLFSIAVAGLSIGLLAGRGIRGTCGGLNGPDGCGACGRERRDSCPRRGKP